MFLLHPALDGTDGLGINVNRIDGPGLRHPLCSSHREPSRTGPDVGNRLTWGDGENVHHTIDVKPFVSSGRIEDGEIAGVGRAGLALLRRLRRGLLRPCSCAGPSKQVNNSSAVNKVKRLEAMTKLRPVS